MKQTWAEKNKEHLKEYRKQYYLKNKEEMQEKNKKWRKAHHEQYKQLSVASYHRRKSDPKNIIFYMLKHAKARAVKKNLEFNLEESDIILPEICPILGVPLSKNGRRYGYSLDRKDPTQGYTKDNVWVISQLANAMKWDSTHEERVAFAKWVQSLEGGNWT